MIQIEEVKEFRKIIPIIQEFCKENLLTKEKTEEQIRQLEENFEREDTRFFSASIEKKITGFLSCEITKRMIITQRLFAIKNDIQEKVIFELMNGVSKKLESLNKDYFQTFYIQSFNLKKKLEKNNFNVYPRTNMVYEMKENNGLKADLHPDYKLENFSLDKLDEELQIVVEANKNTLDGKIFKQFTDLEQLRDFFYRSNKNIERVRLDSPIVTKDGKIVGVNIVINLNENTSYIWVIALLSEHRGKGLGKYLMMKAHENCRKSGIEKIILDVTLNNKVAHGLYNKLGYKETKRYLTVLKVFKK